MKISIIIPTLNEAAQIGNLLKFLLKAVPKKTEIIIVDGESKDDTVQICAGYPVQIYSSKPSRAMQQNLGAKVAQHPYLYFLHADTTPPKSLMADLNDCIKKGNQAACYRSSYNSPSFMLRINAFFTRFNMLAFRGGDQSLLIKKSLFVELNGFDESYVIMEEYPLIQQLMARNALHIIPKNINISARKYAQRSWVKVNIANLKAFSLFRSGADSEQIYKVYKDALR